MVFSGRVKNGIFLLIPIVCLSLILTSLVVFSAPSNAGELTTEQLQDAESQLNSLPYMPELITACPADIMGERMTWFRRLTASSLSWSENSCRANFQGCLKACLNSHNSEACFKVARVFETFDNDRYDLARRQGFALSCALGNANGCTNRGANIRNAYAEVDPFFEAYTGDKDDCLARSFEQACAKSSEWGCAMAGQAHRLGQGVPVDFEKAFKRLEKACLLSDENKDTASERAPCRFAREQMKLLENRSQE